MLMSFEMKKTAQIAIEFREVSKKFKKGRKLLLKEALLDMFRPGKTEDFWALKDISFEVQKGETLGIIGPNGSGKSTILKLIAGVMAPNSGSVAVHGKIAPLIELGAGFHPELSGRENIYLNATILGLRRKEIDAKFNEIVNFADLGEFIDTPIKHYSSGMYMRLAFAVAVHTTPDILLMDEILAVGDVTFQKKCFKKMEEFRKSGVTIVFISHSLEMVGDFCERTIFLEEGKLKKIGRTDEVIAFYRKSSFV